MKRRKVSSDTSGESSPARTRKVASSKMASKAAPAPTAAPRARRATRQKTEQFQLAAPTEVGFPPTEVGFSSAVTDDRVRERAYLLAEQNGFAGDPTFYWRMAERELLGRRA